MARFLSDDLSEKDKKRMERELEGPGKKGPLPYPLKVFAVLAIVTACLASCFYFLYLNKNKKPDVPPAPPEEPAPETPSIVSDSDLMAEGTVIIIDIDKEGRTIRFRDPTLGDEYVLNATDSTVYEDLKGNPMVMEQLKTGDIVDILVSVHSSNLRSVKRNEDSEAFEFPDITDYNINLNKGVFTIEDRNYRILKGTTVIASGELSSFKQIQTGDVLTVCGIGKDVYTVSETYGEGYVRITGAESFKGGWIEMGNVIRPIVENEDEMLLTLPEGAYTLNVSYMHFGGTKSVNVRRGKETRVDVSDLKGDLLKTGVITFDFDPIDASPAVKIDGKLVIKEDPIELDYGVHTLDIAAEGYLGIHKYLKVGEPQAHLSIILEKDDKDTASSNSSDKNTGKKESEKDKDDKKDSSPIPTEALPEVFRSKTSSSSSAKTDEDMEENKPEEANEGDTTDTVTTDTNQLYIDGPQGAEIYFDGAYKGIAPCHFKKSPGTHVVTLMMNGYETKSYTLNLSTGNENESYSFNELVQEYADEDP